MATTRAEQTRNLTEGTNQVLQALVGSMAPDAGISAQTKLSAEQVQTISEKLDDLLGQDGTAAARIEKGEVLNEEGLPIIEISEPDDAVDNSTHAMVPRDEEDVPNPWLTLTPAELEARRRHNKRLLDALEEEERQEEERAAERERAQHQQDLAKRKEAARDEIERLKAQRELQKRMGKALMRNMAAAREREEKREQEVIQDGHAACTENAKRLKPRKSVSFAELPENAPKDGGGARTAPLEWGDVAPGRLIGRDDTLAKRSRQDRAPMKYDVVERFPNRCVKPTIVSVEGDSDDESDPGLLSPNDHTDRNDAHSDSESTDTLADENDDSKGQEEAGDTALLEEEYDFDSAQHQREVALRYFEQRGTIGKDALEAMTSHSHEEGEHEWDQPEVPLEATLASAPPKPTISKFKSARLASTTRIPSSGPSDAELQSTSLSGAILPASQAKALDRSIRTGKLQDGKLVGGEAGESDDESPDANVQKFMEMLKRGEIRNVGPEVDDTRTPISGAPSNRPVAVSQTVQERIPRAPSTSDQSRTSADPVSPKPLASKFKMNRSLQGIGRSGVQANPSPLGTPISVVKRSSPKLPAVKPVVGAEVVERASSTTSASPSLFDSAVGLSLHTPSTCRGPVPIAVPTSTSRPPQPMGASGSRQQVAQSPLLPTAMPSMIVDSPSFPRPIMGGYSRAELVTTARTDVPSPSLTVQDQQRLAEVEAVSASSPASPAQKPAMAMQVVESARQGKALVVPAEGEAPKKLSRFLAERNY